MTFRAYLALPFGIGLLASAAAAAPPAPQIDTAAQLAKVSLPFTYDSKGVAGPGGDFLTAKAKTAQFVLAGESPHANHDIPLFDQAVYTMLRRSYGFQYAAVEQDPEAIALLSSRAGKPADLAKALQPYPTLLGFASDQDLSFLSSALDTPTKDAVWGLEQAQGPVRYLEELTALAPTPTLKQRTGDLLSQARVAEPDRKGFANFLGIQSLTTLPKLQQLKADWAPAVGSRADTLLTGLVKSAEIYSYILRARAGERTGLYNNTVREDWFKQGFMAHYRVAAAKGAPPKVFAKFGAGHMYRGRGLLSAWTIGNFLHEFAISNGKDAFGMYVMAVKEDGWAGEDVWLNPILPKDAPAGPIVIDLAALRPVAAAYTAGLSDKDAQSLLDLIHGYEALVVLPHSQPASWTLTGFSD